ncbi:MAG: aminotransferase class III-fold pyridoxal phosphate-dependent enzyme, partial [Syntrophomonas sp.]
AHQKGALFILDETITGFRYAAGGAQELFGISADLVTFGKGLSNGFPLSAICGRADIMKMMNDIFFSFTFGGETLSLAAAKATMTKITREPVIQRMWQQGEKILTGLRELIAEHELESIFSLAGLPVWSFIIIQDTETYSQWELKTLFMQEMLARGILTLGNHNISYSHSDEDISKLLNAYSEVLPLIKHVVKSKSLNQELRCKPLEPLFKIR